MINEKKGTSEEGGKEGLQGRESLMAASRSAPSHLSNLPLMRTERVSEALFGAILSG